MIFDGDLILVSIGTGRCSGCFQKRTSATANGSSPSIPTRSTCIRYERGKKRRGQQGNEGISNVCFLFPSARLIWPIFTPTGRVVQVATVAMATGLEPRRTRSQPTRGLSVDALQCAGTQSRCPQVRPFFYWNFITEFTEFSFREKKNTTRVIFNSIFFLQNWGRRSLSRKGN